MAKGSCRRAVTQTLERLAVHNDRLFFLTTDSRGSATAGGLADRFPERFIEVGIAEQDAIGIASGLALVGKTPFVMGPACFLAARAYEQIKVDVAYAKADVKIIGVSAGVSYGPLGGTHTALHDVAGMRVLPNIEVFAPSDAVQAEAITRYIAASSRPAYLRTGRGDVEAVYEDGETFEMSKAKLVRDGGDVTLIACGEMVWHTKQAADLLAAQGIEARVLDMFCLKPGDSQAVIKAARETGAIVTIEEHSVHGGLGEMVCGITAQNCSVPVRVLGFPDEEYKVGKSEELFVHYGLDAKGIASRTLKFIKEAGR